ncbi:uncharacterized protein BO97DRAFT_423559 [Aspergillus homomorphus CBS 101889]|uniref:C2H2-type domain-containing protein n=1 Tax=Aspergillus homomorphus (strain CBS 101889) TaxID=1450537 RepID=A0A395HZJ0_ASPHC|nr:hypothetical protein BO97DRAFT_423559 [Aspergillus homomorphus CBS 101889]RAL13351.1 hypothetical protein BO97DRAFT_423559 [Aspergillus homomorphus CBS 101889]
MPSLQPRAGGPDTDSPLEGLSNLRLLDWMMIRRNYLVRMADNLGIEIPLGGPNTASLLDQVLRCKQLEEDMHDIEPRTGLMGFFCYDVQQFATDFVGEFNFDYPASKLSRLRTCPITQWELSRDLADLEEHQREFMWRCESFPTAKDDLEPLTVEKGRFFQVPPSVLNKLDKLSQEFRGDALRGLQEKYPLAKSFVHEAIVERMFDIWRLLTWRQRGNHLGDSTRKPGIPQAAPAPTTTLLPPPPKFPAVAKEVLCPYCSDMIPVSICRTVPWKSHILHDFRPYVCIKWDTCKKAFVSAENWEKHMLNHTQYWGCDEQACQGFSIPLWGYRDRIEEHCRVVHGWADLPPPSLNERPAAKLEYNECPLCQEPFPENGDSAQIKWHIAGHL